MENMKTTTRTQNCKKIQSSRKSDKRCVVPTADCPVDDIGACRRFTSSGVTSSSSSCEVVVGDLQKIDGLLLDESMFPSLTGDSNAPGMVGRREPSESVRVIGTHLNVSIDTHLINPQIPSEGLV